MAMDALLHDARHALRRLVKSPRFAVVVVLTLAVGIAANTIIFSVADSVFFHGLPYPDGDRLVFVSRAYPGFPQGGGNFTYAAYHDMLAQNTSFDVFAAYQGYGALALTDHGDPVRVAPNYITPSYLPLLGAKPFLGRIFRPEEDRFGDADAVVLLSYSFWQRQLGADPNIVGSTIHLNDRPLTVVGVLSPDFRDALNEEEHHEETDAWIPLGMAYTLTGFSAPNDRAGAILWGVGRLKPGVTFAHAREDFAAIAERLAVTYPATDSGFGLVARPLKDYLIGVFYTPARILLAASAFLLLIGCANVANLLLARLLARQRELAVRSALGASPRRLVHHLLIENVTLTVVAGALGLLLAMWGMNAFRGWGSAHLPPVIHLQPNAWVLLASVAVSLATGLLFGLAPALLGSRVNLRDALNQGGRQGQSLARRRGQKILVAVEVGLAMVVLAAAGLLVQSFRKLESTPLGFDTHNLLTLRLELRSARYTEPAARAEFARTLVEKLEPLPGVESVTLWGPSMLGRATWVYIAHAEGVSDDDANARLMMGRHAVNPGALANLGIPLLRGRDITWQDVADVPAVAVISESVANRLWPGQDPIGKRMRSTSNFTPWVTVIGVARDTRHAQRFDLNDATVGIAPLGLGPQYDAYFPYVQRPNGAVTLALRVGRDAKSVAQELKATVLAIDPQLPVFDIAMLDDRLESQIDPLRTMAVLTGAYAAVALFLAAFGLFAVLAHDVSQRLHEMGIRMALGAQRRNVMALVLREGLLVTVAGLAAGVLFALTVTRAMKNLLFGVDSADPAVFLSIALLLVSVAVLACLIPARRAMRLDPMAVLRGE
ncbi:MAG TPA: ABC transporter permease [Candidatus Solibacter sp.]|nr:ABC transporter permease [Candidatus Solibacter sp.]